MHKVELTCTCCPLGCLLTATLENNQVITVTGNSCKIGLEYAKEECIHPTRLLTSTILVINGILPRVAVKTAKPIPKEMIMPCMEAIKKLKMRAPINLGDIICKDLAHTGISLIATQSILKTP